MPANSRLVCIEFQCQILVTGKSQAQLANDLSYLQILARKHACNIMMLLVTKRTRLAERSQMWYVPRDMATILINAMHCHQHLRSYLVTVNCTICCASQYKAKGHLLQGCICDISSWLLFADGTEKAARLQNYHVALTATKIKLLHGVRQTGKHWHNQVVKSS